MEIFIDEIWYDESELDFSNDLNGEVIYTISDGEDWWEYCAESLGTMISHFPTTMMTRQ